MTLLYVPAGHWQDNICIAKIKHKNIAKTMILLSFSRAQNRNIQTE